MSEITEFLAFVEIYRAADDRRIENEIFHGTIRLKNELLSSLTILRDGNSIASITHNGRTIQQDAIEKHVDRQITLEAQTPFSEQKGGFFVSSMDELLRRVELRFNCPESFYIAKNNCLYPDDKSDDVRQYVAATRLTNGLRRISQFKDNDTLIFLSHQRFDLLVQYSESDLQSLDAELVDALLAELFPSTHDHHSERRRELFSNELRQSVRGIHRERMLAYVFDNLKDIVFRYRADYEIYAKDFTTEALLDDLESRKTEQLGKMTAVVQDIAIKLLSVPLAYILIAGQLVENAATKNHIIIFGAFVFMVLMCLLISNQIYTLFHVWQDISSIEDFFRNRLRHPRLSKAISKLRRYFSVQMTVLLIVLAVTIGVFYSSFNLYEEYTDLSGIGFLNRFEKNHESSIK